MYSDGIDVNATYKYRCLNSIYEDRALHIALAMGYVDFAKVLIQNGADVNVADVQQETEGASSQQV